MVRFKVKNKKLKKKMVRNRKTFDWQSRFRLFGSNWKIYYTPQKYHFTVVIVGIYLTEIK